MLTLAWSFRVHWIFFNESSQVIFHFIPDFAATTPSIWEQFFSWKCAWNFFLCSTRLVFLVHLLMTIACTQIFRLTHKTRHQLVLDLFFRRRLTTSLVVEYRLHWDQFFDKANFFFAFVVHFSYVYLSFSVSAIIPEPPSIYFFCFRHDMKLKNFLCF